MRARAWGSTLRKSDALKKCIAYQWYAKANDFYFMDVANKPNNKGKKKIKTPGDLQNIVKSSLVANNKTILVVIYNNENQISYIGIKLK